MLKRGKSEKKNVSSFIDCAHRFFPLVTRTHISNSIYLGTERKVKVKERQKEYDRSKEKKYKNTLFH